MRRTRRPAPQRPTCVCLDTIRCAVGPREGRLVAERTELAGELAPALTEQAQLASFGLAQPMLTRIDVGIEGPQRRLFAVRVEGVDLRVDSGDECGQRGLSPSGYRGGEVPPLEPEPRGQQTERPRSTGRNSTPSCAHFPQATRPVASPKLTMLDGAQGLKSPTAMQGHRPGRRTELVRGNRRVTAETAKPLAQLSTSTP